MEYYVLASGSAGNSTFIKFKEKGILIDCGVSRKQLVYRLEKCGYQLKDIDYVFLTHDHFDHNKNIHLFEKRIIYAGKDCVDDLPEQQIFQPYQPITFASLSIIPLPLSHDATCCFGFVFLEDNQKLVYVTDTGYVSSKNASYMQNANYYIIESNHDVSMLMNTKRPMYLKNRILSDYGHLSNLDSAHLIARLIGNQTKEIVLAHLSREANTPELALETYRRMISDDHIDIKVASQIEVVGGGNSEN